MTAGWTDDRVGALKKLWLEGQSASQIAKQLGGGVTRNAVIGGLLGFYGVVLVIRGLLDGAEQLAQAAGFAVNLWTGIVLVVVAIAFLAWASLRPLGIEVDEDAEEMGAPPA